MTADRVRPNKFPIYPTIKKMWHVLFGPPYNTENIPACCKPTCCKPTFMETNIRFLAVESANDKGKTKKKTATAEKAATGSLLSFFSIWIFVRLLRMPKTPGCPSQTSRFFIFLIHCFFDHVPIFFFITDVQHTLNPRQRRYMG